MMKNKNLFLIGYRCTGKTTVAELVAKRLGWEWIDADAALEARHGQNIAQIFASEGETGFRNKEAVLLAEFCGAQKRVVATGGGVILRRENRDRLRDAGLCAWLVADARTIVERLESDPATKHRRPNLTVGGLAEIEQLLKIREPLYRQCADWVIDTANRTPHEVAEEIFGKVSGEW